MTASTLAEIRQKAQDAATIDDYWQAAELYTQLLQAINPQTATAETKEWRLEALRERGLMLRLVGEQAAALAAYEQYYLEAGSSKHAVEALVLIGNAQAGIGQYRRSLQAFQEALDIAEALNFTVGRAQSQEGSGGTYLRMGKMDEAATSLARAQALFEQIEDMPGQIRTLNKQGIAYALSGEMDKAIASFAETRRLAQTHDLLENQLAALNNLGECYQQLYHLEQAEAYHREGLALAEKAQLRILEADICRNLGVDLVLQDQIDAGLVYLRRALAISQDTEDLDLRLNTLYNLSLAELGRNNAAVTRPYIDELQQTADTNNLRGHLAHAAHVQGLVAQKQGDLQTAQELWQQALFLAHETNKRILLWQIHAELADIADNVSLAVVHNRIAAEVIEQIAEPIADDTLRQTFLNAPAIKAILDKTII